MRVGKAEIVGAWRDKGKRTSLLRGCGFFFGLLSCIFALTVLPWTQWLKADLTLAIAIPDRSLGVRTSEQFINSEVDWLAFQDLMVDSQKFFDTMWDGSTHVIWTHYNLSDTMTSPLYTWDMFELMWSLSDPGRLPSQTKERILAETKSENITTVNWATARANGMTLTRAVSLLQDAEKEIKSGFDERDIRVYLARTWDVSKPHIAYEGIKDFVLVGTLLDTLTEAGWRRLLPITREANQMLEMVGPYQLDKVVTYMQLLAVPHHTIQYGVTRSFHSLSVTSSNGDGFKAEYSHVQPYGSGSSGRWPNSQWLSTAVLLGFGLVFTIAGLGCLIWSIFATPQVLPLLLGLWALLLAAFWLFVSFTTFPGGLGGQCSLCQVVSTEKLRTFVIDVAVAAGAERNVATTSLQTMSCNDLFPPTYPLCRHSSGSYQLGDCELRAGPTLLYIACLCTILSAVAVLLQWKLAKSKDGEYRKTTEDVEVNLPPSLDRGRKKNKSAPGMNERQWA